MDSFDMDSFDLDSFEVPSFAAPDIDLQSFWEDVVDVGTATLSTWPDNLDIRSMCMNMNSICQSVAEDLPNSPSDFARRRYGIWIPLLLVMVEVLRILWHRIRLVALNFRRHTPPSTSYTVGMSFDQHANFVEELFCDRADVASCVEGLFVQHRDVRTIERDMLEDAILTHLSMEVRRWYPVKHVLTADRIIKRIEEKLGHAFERSDKTREFLPGGASIAKPVAYDAHPDAARKPFFYIGEQQLKAYFKPLPVQCVIWLAKALKTFLFRYWGFKWHDLGPVQAWVLHPEPGSKAELEPPLMFCPGLFLGNTAYIYFIYRGLLPFGRLRPLILLELPHLSHGIDPRKIAYSLRYSWPSSDEISDAIATYLQSWPCPCDIVGDSFGTVVMTALRREHRHLFRKFVYFDPVCFIPCFPSSLLCASSQMDSYGALLRKALKLGGGLPRLKWLFKFLVLRPVIFGDTEVQYVMKRGLYVHEITEQGALGKESLVVIGRNDDLIEDPVGVGHWVSGRWPESSVQFVDFNHGAIMGNPKPFAKLLQNFLQEEQ